MKSSRSHFDELKDQIMPAQQFLDKIKEREFVKSLQDETRQAQRREFQSNVINNLLEYEKELHAQLGSYRVCEDKVLAPLLEQEFQANLNLYHQFLEMLDALSDEKFPLKEDVKKELALLMDGLSFVVRVAREKKEEQPNFSRFESDLRTTNEKVERIQTSPERKQMWDKIAYGLE